MTAAEQLSLILEMEKIRDKAKKIADELTAQIDNLSFELKIYDIPGQDINEGVANRTETVQQQY